MRGEPRLPSECHVCGMLAFGVRRTSFAREANSKAEVFDAESGSGHSGKSNNARLPNSASLYHS